jgi:hypothetical protein
VLAAQRRTNPARKLRRILDSIRRKEMAAPQGFEPRYAAPEAAVLPLNEGAVDTGCWEAQGILRYIDFMGWCARASTCDRRLCPEMFALRALAVESTSPSLSRATMNASFASTRVL